MPSECKADFRCAYDLTLIRAKGLGRILIKLFEAFLIPFVESKEKIRLLNLNRLEFET